MSTALAISGSTAATFLISDVHYRHNRAILEATFTADCLGKRAVGHHGPTEYPALTTACRSASS